MPHPWIVQKHCSKLWTVVFKIEKTKFNATIGFDPTTSGLWAQHASSAPRRVQDKWKKWQFEQYVKCYLSEIRNTSAGARAMHDFGAEVFIEEVQWYDDILYRCIVFSKSYFVDALIIKMEIWRSIHYWDAFWIRITQSTCSQGGGPCEGFEKRWRTTTTSVRGVWWKIYGFSSLIGRDR